MWLICAATQSWDSPVGGLPPTIYTRCNACIALCTCWRDVHAAGLKLRGYSSCFLTFPKKGKGTFWSTNKLRLQSLRSQLTTYSRDLMPVNYSPGGKKHYCDVRRLVVQSQTGFVVRCDATWSSVSAGPVSRGGRHGFERRRPQIFLTLQRRRSALVGTQD